MGLNTGSQLSYNERVNENKILIYTLDKCFALRDTDSIIDNKGNIKEQYLLDIKSNKNLLILKAMYITRLALIHAFDILDNIEDIYSIEYSNASNIVNRCFETIECNTKFHKYSEFYEGFLNSIDLARPYIPR